MAFLANRSFWLAWCTSFTFLFLFRLLRFQIGFRFIFLSILFLWLDRNLAMFRLGSLLFSGFNRYLAFLWCWSLVFLWFYRNISVMFSLRLAFGMGIWFRMASCMLWNRFWLLSSFSFTEKIVSLLDCFVHSSSSMKLFRGFWFFFSSSLFLLSSLHKRLFRWFLPAFRFWLFRSTLFLSFLWGFFLTC